MNYFYSQNHANYAVLPPTMHVPPEPPHSLDLPTAHKMAVVPSSSSHLMSNNDNSDSCTSNNVIHPNHTTTTAGVATAVRPSASASALSVSLSGVESASTGRGATIPIRGPPTLHYMLHGSGHHSSHPSTSPRDGSNSSASSRYLYPMHSVTPEKQSSNVVHQYPRVGLEGLLVDPAGEPVGGHHRHDSPNHPSHPYAMNAPPPPPSSSLHNGDPSDDEEKAQGNSRHHGHPVPIIMSSSRVAVTGASRRGGATVGGRNTTTTTTTTPAGQETSSLLLSAQKSPRAAASEPEPSTGLAVRNNGSRSGKGSDGRGGAAAFTTFIVYSPQGPRPLDTLCIERPVSSRQAGSSGGTGRESTPTAAKAVKDSNATSEKPPSRNRSGSGKETTYAVRSAPTPGGRPPSSSSFISSVKSVFDKSTRSQVLYIPPQHHVSFLSTPTTARLKLANNAADKRRTRSAATRGSATLLPRRSHSSSSAFVNRSGSGSGIRGHHDTAVLTAEDRRPRSSLGQIGPASGSTLPPHTLFPATHCVCAIQCCYGGDHVAVDPGAPNQRHSSSSSMGASPAGGGRGSNAMAILLHQHQDVVWTTAAAAARAGSPSDVEEDTAPQHVGGDQRTQTLQTVRKSSDEDAAAEWKPHKRKSEKPATQHGRRPTTPATSALLTVEFTICSRSLTPSSSPVTLYRIQYSSGVKADIAAAVASTSSARLVRLPLPAALVPGCWCNWFVDLRALLWKYWQLEWNPAQHRLYQLRISTSGMPGGNVPATHSTIRGGAEENKRQTKSVVPSLPQPLFIRRILALPSAPMPSSHVIANILAMPAATPSPPPSSFHAAHTREEKEGTEPSVLDELSILTSAQATPSRQAYQRHHAQFIATSEWSKGESLPDALRIPSDVCGPQRFLYTPAHHLLQWLPSPLPQTKSVLGNEIEEEELSALDPPPPPPPLRRSSTMPPLSMESEDTNHHHHNNNNNNNNKNHHSDTTAPMHTGRETDEDHHREERSKTDANTGRGRSSRHSLKEEEEKREPEAVTAVHHFHHHYHYSNGNESDGHGHRLGALSNNENHRDDDDHHQAAIEVEVVEEDVDDTENEADKDHDEDHARRHTMTLEDQWYDPKEHHHAPLPPPDCWLPERMRSLPSSTNPYQHQHQQDQHYASSAAESPLHEYGTDEGEAATRMTITREVEVLEVEENEAEVNTKSARKQPLPPPQQQQQEEKKRFTLQRGPWGGHHPSTPGGGAVTGNPSMNDTSIRSISRNAAPESPTARGRRSALRAKPQKRPLSPPHSLYPSSGHHDDDDDDDGATIATIEISLAEAALEEQHQQPHHHSCSSYPVLRQNPNVNHPKEEEEIPAEQYTIVHPGRGGTAATATSGIIGVDHHHHHHEKVSRQPLAEYSVHQQVEHSQQETRPLSAMDTNDSGLLRSTRLLATQRQKLPVENFAHGRAKGKGKGGGGGPTAPAALPDEAAKKFSGVSIQAMKDAAAAAAVPKKLFPDSRVPVGDTSSQTTALRWTRANNSSSNRRGGAGNTGANNVGGEHGSSVLSGLLTHSTVERLQGSLRPTIPLSLQRAVPLPPPPPVPSSSRSSAHSSAARVSSSLDFEPEVAKGSGRDWREGTSRPRGGRTLPATATTNTIGSLADSTMSSSSHEVLSQRLKELETLRDSLLLSSDSPAAQLGSARTPTRQPGHPGTAIGLPPLSPPHQEDGDEGRRGNQQQDDEDHHGVSGVSTGTEPVVAAKTPRGVATHHHHLHCPQQQMARPSPHSPRHREEHSSSLLLYAQEEEELVKLLEQLDSEVSSSSTNIHSDSDSDVDAADPLADANANELGRRRASLLLALMENRVQQIREVLGLPPCASLLSPSAQSAAMAAMAAERSKHFSSPSNCSLRPSSMDRAPATAVHVRPLSSPPGEVDDYPNNEDEVRIRPQREHDVKTPSNKKMENEGERAGEHFYGHRELDGDHHPDEWESTDEPYTNHEDDEEDEEDGEDERTQERIKFGHHHHHSMDQPAKQRPQEADDVSRRKPPLQSGTSTTSEISEHLLTQQYRSAQLHLPTTAYATVSSSTISELDVEEEEEEGREEGNEIPDRHHPIRDSVHHQPHDAHDSANNHHDPHSHEEEAGRSLEKRIKGENVPAPSALGEWLNARNYAREVATEGQLLPPAEQQQQQTTMGQLIEEEDDVLREKRIPSQPGNDKSVPHSASTPHTHASHTDVDILELWRQSEEPLGWTTALAHAEAEHEPSHPVDAPLGSGTAEHSHQHRHRHRHHHLHSLEKKRHQRHGHSTHRGERGGAGTTHLRDPEKKEGDEDEDEDEVIQDSSDAEDMAEERRQKRRREKPYRIPFRGRLHSGTTITADDGEEDEVDGNEAAVGREGLKPISAPPSVSASSSSSSSFIPVTTGGALARPQPPSERVPAPQPHRCAPSYSSSAAAPLPSGYTPSGGGADWTQGWMIPSESSSSSLPIGIDAKNKKYSSAMHRQQATLASDDTTTTTTTTINKNHTATAADADPQWTHPSEDAPAPQLSISAPSAPPTPFIPASTTGPQPVGFMEKLAAYLQSPRQEWNHSSGGVAPGSPPPSSSSFRREPREEERTPVPSDRVGLTQEEKGYAVADREAVSELAQRRMHRPLSSPCSAMNVETKSLPHSDAPKHTLPLETKANDSSSTSPSTNKTVMMKKKKQGDKGNTCAQTETGIQGMVGLVIQGKAISRGGGGGVEKVVEQPTTTRAPPSTLHMMTPPPAIHSARMNTSDSAPLTGTSSGLPAPSTIPSTAVGPDDIIPHNNNHNNNDNDHHTSDPVVRPPPPPTAAKSDFDTPRVSWTFHSATTLRRLLRSGSASDLVEQPQPSAEEARVGHHGSSTSASENGVDTCSLGDKGSGGGGEAGVEDRVERHLEIALKATGHDPAREQDASGEREWEFSLNNNPAGGRHPRVAAGSSSHVQRQTNTKNAEEVQEEMTPNDTTAVIEPVLEPSIDPSMQQRHRASQTTSSTTTTRTTAAAAAAAEKGTNHHHHHHNVHSHSHHPHQTFTHPSVSSVSSAGRLQRFHLEEKDPAGSLSPLFQRLAQQQQQHQQPSHHSHHPETDRVRTPDPAPLTLQPMSTAPPPVEAAAAGPPLPPSSSPSVSSTAAVTPRPSTGADAGVWPIPRPLFSPCTGTTTPRSFRCVNASQIPASALRRVRYSLTSVTPLSVLESEEALGNMEELVTPARQATAAAAEELVQRNPAGAAAAAAAATSSAEHPHPLPPNHLGGGSNEPSSREGTETSSSPSSSFDQPPQLVLSARGGAEKQQTSLPIQSSAQPSPSPQHQPQPQHSQAKELDVPLHGKVVDKERHPTRTTTTTTRRGWETLPPPPPASARCHLQGYAGPDEIRSPVPASPVACWPAGEKEGWMVVVNHSSTAAAAAAVTTTNTSTGVGSHPMDQYPPPPHEMFSGSLHAPSKTVAKGDLSTLRQGHVFDPLTTCYLDLRTNTFVLD